MAWVLRCLRDVPSGRDDQQQTNGQVDEEAGTPGHQVGEQSAQHQSQRGTYTGRCCVHGQCAGARRAFGEVSRQQGQCGWRKNGGTGTLDGAGCEQPARRWSNTNRHRCQREQEEPHDEHAPAAQDVARASPQQQQTSEGQGIGIGHPRKLGGAEAQAGLDARQAGDDDGDVHHDHQVAGHDDGQHDAGVAGLQMGLGGVHGLRSDVQLAFGHPLDDGRIAV